MGDFINECESTISKVQTLLRAKSEWIERYDIYAKEIHANLETIQLNKKKFHQWAPLYLYMNVSEAKGNLTFGLRYLGQEVARLKVGTEKISISTKGFNENNKRDFKCDVSLENCEWRSEEAKKFRHHFSVNPERNDSGKGNEEHRIECLLLTEFSKKSSMDKKILNIQPVKIAGIARFQMPTPLSASGLKALKYSGPSGGGIDVLARIGKGKATNLCIMEVKDENVSKEPPAKAIQQGLAYATFIQALLRSKSGKAWWEFFGFNGERPKTINLYVVCVMPSTNNDDTSFANQKIKIDKDVICLHCVYFKESENKITGIVTSLKECPISQC